MVAGQIPDESQFVMIPVSVVLYHCPVCGRRIESLYNIDTARKKCSKLWHKAIPVAHTYVRRATA